MTSTTRAEREARIARDDGDPEDTVQLSARGNNGSRSAYHEPGCTQLPEETTERTRAWAQRRQHPPCKDCVLGETDAQANLSPGGKSKLERYLDGEEVEWNVD